MRTIIASVVLFLCFAFVTPAKQVGCHRLSTVNVDFSTDATVTFTGEWGQGTYVFDVNNPTHNMPAWGWYTITLQAPEGSNVRLSTDNANILLAQGNTVVTYHKHIVSQYYAHEESE